MGRRLIAVETCCCCINAVMVYSSAGGGLFQLLKRCWGLEMLKPGHYVLFSEWQQ